MLGRTTPRLSMEPHHAAVCSPQRRLAALARQLASSSSVEGVAAQQAKRGGGRNAAVELGPLSRAALEAQSEDDAALQPADGLQAGLSNLIARGVVEEATACHASALAEITAGQKQGHWIWWVFPTLSEHGADRNTPIAAGIYNLAEAEAYLRIGVLRDNYLAVLQAAGVSMAKHDSLQPWHVFDSNFGRSHEGQWPAVPNADGSRGSSGPVDSYKVRISCTLFAIAARNIGDHNVLEACLAALAHFSGDVKFTLPDGSQTLALAGPDPLTMRLVGQPDAFPTIGASPAAAQENYELRLYHTLPQPAGSSADPVGQFLRDAFIPACNRMGIDRVGVFIPEGGQMLYVLLRHASLEVLATLDHSLMTDDAFATASVDFHDATKAQPKYEVVERTLMRSMTGMPQLEAPTSPDNPDRIFQLRVYESPGYSAAQTKIEMFNSAEIEIFRNHGLQPVFFSETLTGAILPSLTYMLSFDNEEAKASAWDSFRDSGEWKELSGRAQYSDDKIIRKITDIPLAPAAFSQI
jgi:uncharacterized protein (DUF1810 family)